MKKNSLQYPNGRTPECFVPSSQYHNQPKPIIPPPLEVILSQPLTPAHDVTALEDAIHHPGSEVMFLDASLQYLLHTLHTQLQDGLNESANPGDHDDPFFLTTNVSKYTDGKSLKESMSISDTFSSNGKNVHGTVNDVTHDYCGSSSHFKSNNFTYKTTNEKSEIMRNMCNDRGLKPYFNTYPFRNVAATNQSSFDKTAHSLTDPCNTPDECLAKKPDDIKVDDRFGEDRLMKSKKDEEETVKSLSYEIENVYLKQTPEEKVRSPDSTDNCVASECETSTYMPKPPFCFSLNTKKNLDQSEIIYSERNALIPQPRHHVCPLVDSILLNRSTTTSIGKESACHKSRPPYPIQEYNDRRVPRSFVTPHISGPSDVSIDSSDTRSGSDITLATQESLEKSNTAAQFSNISSIFAFMNPILNKECAKEKQSNTSNQRFCLADKDDVQTDSKQNYVKKPIDLGLPCTVAKSKRFDRFQSCFDVKKPVTDLIHKGSVAGMFDNSPAVYFRHEFNKGVIMKDNYDSVHTTNTQKRTLKSPGELEKSNESTQYSDSLEVIPSNLRIKTDCLPTKKNSIPDKSIKVQGNPFEITDKDNKTFRYRSYEPEPIPRPFYLGDKSLSTISEERTVSTASDGIKAELSKIKEEDFLTRPCQSRQCSRKSLRRINSLQKVQEIFHNNRFASSVSSFASETKSRFTCRIKGSKMLTAPIIGADRGPFPLPNDGFSVEYEWNKERIGKPIKNHTFRSEDPRKDNILKSLPINKYNSDIKNHLTTSERDRMLTRIKETDNRNRKTSAEKRDGAVSQQKMYNVGKSGDCGSKIFKFNMQNPNDTNKKKQKDNYCFKNYTNPSSIGWNKNETPCVAYGKIKTDHDNHLFHQHSGGESLIIETNSNQGPTKIKQFSHSTEEISVPEKYAFDWPKSSKINKDYLSRSKVYHRQSVDIQKAVRFDENNISTTARTVGGKNASPFEWSFMKKDPGTKCSTIPNLEEKYSQEGLLNKEHTGTRRHIGRKESDLSIKKLVPRFEWQNMFKSPRSLYSNSNHVESKPKKVEKNLNAHMKVPQDIQEKYTSDQNRKQRPAFEWHNIFKRPRSVSLKHDPKLLKQSEEEPSVLRDSFEQNATRRSAFRPCLRKPTRSRSSSAGLTLTAPWQSNQIQGEKRSILKQSKKYTDELNQDLKQNNNECSRMIKPVTNNLNSMEGNTLSSKSNSTALGYSRLSPYYQQWLAKRHRPAPKFTHENLEEFKKKILLPPKVQQHYEAKERERKLFEEHSGKNAFKIKGNKPCKRKFKSYFNAS